MDSSASARSRWAAADLEPTPFEIVHRENEVRLRHYASRGEESRDLPVVIAYALINDPSILDLRSDLSVVGQFLDRGFDVYVIDWGDPGRLDATLSIDDYVCRFVANTVAAAREHAAGADAVHLVGCSTTSPLAAAYAALFPAAVATLTLQGPPLDFGADGGMLDFRDLVATLSAHGGVPGGLVPNAAIDLGFATRKPFEFAVGKPLELWEHRDDPAYLDRLARLGRWTGTGRAMASGVVRTFVEDLVVDNRLVENRLELAGQHVDLGNVEMPVALVLGEHDDYVPHAASLPFLDAIPSTDTEVFRFPTGHVGTLAAPVAHDEWWPQVVAWLAGRN